MLQSNSMELVKQDGSDSLDMLIRRAVGKDPFLSFPRPENTPVQLFQLLHTLERPGNVSLSLIFFGFDIFTDQILWNLVDCVLCGYIVLVSRGLSY